MAQDFVFISYARADGREFAERLYQSLREQGFPVWRDQRNLNPYQDFSATIENAIKNASHVLVLLSPSIVDDEDSFVRREILYAQGCQKPVIPLVLPGFPFGKVPTLINHLTRIDFHDYDRGMQLLLARLQNPPDYDTLPLDPFFEHLDQLKLFIAEELSRTVYRSQVMSLRVLDSPNAVMRSQPLAYQSRRPGWFSDSASQQEFESLQQAFEYHERQLLLLGEPGAGKTTSLLAFARNYIDSRLARTSMLLPIFAPIYTWDGEVSLVDWLAQVTNLAPEDVQTAINSKRCLLLLDGLDELPADVSTEDGTPSRDLRVEFVQAVQELLPTPILITCRISGYEEIVHKCGCKINLKGAVTLKPLTDAQIEHYLQPLPSLWTALQHDEQLFEIARTPLILTLLTVAYQDAGDQALATIGNGQRDQIFKTFVLKRYEFEQTWANHPLPYSLEKIYDALGQVALSSWLWGNENEIEISQFRHVLGEDTEHFIEVVQRLHLIRPIRQQIYSFIHALLRDHFAFPYCLNCLQDSNTVVRHGAALALAKMADSRAVEPLVLALRDESHGMRKLAAAALGQIGDTRATSALLLALHDPDKWVRSEAATALGRIGDPQAVESLIDLLHDQSTDVRQNTAEALGLIGDDRAIHPLINTLADDDNRVRRHVMHALRAFGATELLTEALDHPQALIRRGIAITLGELNAIQIVDRLAVLLDDTDVGVRAAAAWALNQLGDPRGAQAIDNSTEWIQSYGLLRKPDDS